MAVPFILDEPFTTYVYPFILVFVLVFAILDRIKILGEGKRQINAIVALVIALMFITFGNAVNIVVYLMPFLGVFAVIILIFLILFGFIYADKDEFKLPNGVKIAGGIIVLVALAIAILIVTGFWETLKGLFSSGNSITTSVIMIVIIGGALALVLSTGKKN